MSGFIKHPNYNSTIINLSNIIRIEKRIDNFIYLDSVSITYVFQFDTQEARDLYYRTLEQYLILDIGL